MIRCRLTLGSTPPDATDYPHAVQGADWALQWDSTQMAMGGRPLTESLFLGCARLENQTALRQQLDLTEGDDLDLLCAAWQRWGTDAAQYLYGDWLLAVRTPDQTLHVLRDANNNVGWYVQHDAQGLRCATTLPALLDCAPSTKIDPISLTLRVVATMAPGTTPFKNTQSLPCGHRLRWQAGEVQLQRWWQPENTPQLKLPNAEAYYAAFRDLYHQIVQALPSAPEYALMLSGGYDSGSVAAFVAPELAQRKAHLKSYTLEPTYQASGFGSKLDSEVEYAEASARHIGQIDLARVNAQDERLLPRLRAQVQASGQPNGTANSLWLNAICRRAHAEGCRTLLTGQGGNMTVSWQGHGHFWRPLLQGNWSQVRGVIGRNPATWRRFVREQIARHLLRPLRKLGRADFAHEFMALKLRVLNPAKRDALLADPEFTAQLTRFTDSQATINNWRTVLLTGDMASGWQLLSEAHRLTIIDPTANRRMVEFCHSVPDWVYWCEGRGRGLIREGLRGILPDMVLDSPLRGLQSNDLLDRLRHEQAEIAACLDEFEQSQLIRSWLNLPQLREALAQACKTTTRLEQFAEITNLLGRGLTLGLFLQIYGQALDGHA